MCWKFFIFRYSIDGIKSGPHQVNVYFIYSTFWAWYIYILRITHNMHFSHSESECCLQYLYQWIDMMTYFGIFYHMLGISRFHYYMSLKCWSGGIEIYHSGFLFLNIEYFVIMKNIPFLSSKWFCSHLHGSLSMNMINMN